MRVLWLAAASMALLSTTAFAAGDTDAFRYLTREEAFALVAKPDPAGKPVSNYLARHDDFSEAVIQRTRSGDVEVHDLYTDYMIMVEGRGTLTIGGTLKNRRAKPDGAKGEWLADASTGGKVHDLKPGVMVIVPKGMPHWVQLPPGGTLRYIFFKRKG
jgi:mannose-6-phosphate isomerase-like protein (cupin superfamily)